MATGCFTLEVIVDYMIALTQTAWAALWRCKWTGTPAGGGACYYCRDFGYFLAPWSRYRSVAGFLSWECWKLSMETPPPLVGLGGYLPFPMLGGQPWWGWCWTVFRPLTCSAVFSSDQNHHCLAELRCLPSDLAMQSSYCAEISDFNPCSRLCCPCSIPCSRYSSPCKSRRTCTRSSWGSRMLPTRSWRMLPRRRRKRVTSKFHFLVTGIMELQLNSIVEYTLGCI